MAITSNNMQAIRDDLDLSGAIALNASPVRFRAGKHSGPISITDLNRTVASWHNDVDPNDHAKTNYTLPQKRHQVQWSSYDPSGGGWDESVSGVKWLGSSTGSNADKHYPNGRTRCTVKAKAFLASDKSTSMYYCGQLSNLYMDSGYYKVQVAIDKMTFSTITGHSYDLAIYSWSNGFFKGYRSEFARVVDVQKANSAPGYYTLSTIENDTTNRLITRSFYMDNLVYYPYLTIIFYAHSYGKYSTNSTFYCDAADVRATQ